MKVQKHVLVIAGGLLLTFGVNRAAGQTTTAKQQKAEARSATKIPIQQFTLKNGLRVVLSEDHSAPTYSICVTYDVGSQGRKAGPHRLRPSVRTHDVSGLGKCG